MSVTRSKDKVDRVTARGLHYREALAMALQDIANLMGEAKRDGFDLSFSLGVWDGQVIPITMTKVVYTKEF